MTIAIVLNYNDFENTYNFVNSTQNYISIDKIIIVDNCSSDSSYEQLLNEKFNRKVELIKTKSNEGYGSGNNFGIKYAEEKYSPQNFIISNPDIEVKNVTIEKILFFLKSNSEASAATGLIHTSQGEIAKNFSWRQPSFRDVLLDNSFILKIISEKLFKSSNRYSINKIDFPIMKVDVLSGCFFVIKADKLREVDYFNENTFLYHEENILFGKLNKKYKQFVLTNEKIIHNQGGTISKNINSWKVKSSWFVESGEVYLKEYLKVKKIYRLMYLKISKILSYERFYSLMIKDKILQTLSIFKK